MTTRRVFLKVLGATGVLPIVGCGPPAVTADNLTVDKVPEGLSFLTGDPVILGRDAGGIYAMTSICTHAGCDIAATGTINGDELDCSCHGSKYNADGTVKAGPAAAPLDHLKVTIGADKTVSVDQNSVVDAAVRAKVPA